MPSKFSVRAAFDGNRRVVVSTRGGSSYELAPLEAAHLAGLLFAGALGLLEDYNLGCPPEGGFPIIVWESFGSGEGGAWNPSHLGTTRHVRREVKRLQEDGAPYMVTILMYDDALALPRERPPDED